MRSRISLSVIIWSLAAPCLAQNPVPQAQGAPASHVVSGAFADLIAVTGDPLRDVNELKNVAFVMKDGVVFKSTFQRRP
jgi:hypothetical protein